MDSFNACNLSLYLMSIFKCGFRGLDRVFPGTVPLVLDLYLIISFTLKISFHFYLVLVEFLSFSCYLMDLISVKLINLRLVGLCSLFFELSNHVTGAPASWIFTEVMCCVASLACKLKVVYIMKVVFNERDVVLAFSCFKNIIRHILYMFCLDGTRC